MSNIGYVYNFFFAFAWLFYLLPLSAFLSQHKEVSEIQLRFVCIETGFVLSLFCICIYILSSWKVVEEEETDAEEDYAEVQ